MPESGHDLASHPHPGVTECTLGRGVGGRPRIALADQEAPAWPWTVGGQFRDVGFVVATHRDHGVETVRVGLPEHQGDVGTLAEPGEDDGSDCPTLPGGVDRAEYEPLGFVTVDPAVAVGSADLSQCIGRDVGIEDLLILLANWS